jgi:hypothetical protein
MLEHEFRKHTEELKEIKDNVEYYLNKHKQKVEELRNLGVEIETSTKDLIYYFPVIYVKYIDIMQRKIT